MVIDNAHGLHGLTKTPNALTLGVSGSIKFNSFGVTNSIGTSPNQSAFASTFATQRPPTFGEKTNKKIKKVDIKSIFKEKWVA